MISSGQTSFLSDQTEVVLSSVTCSRLKFDSEKWPERSWGGANDDSLSRSMA